MKLFTFGLCLGYLLVEIYGNIEHIRPNTTELIQSQAAAAVIFRLIPDKAHFFNVTVDFNLPVSSFKIKQPKNSNTILITASSGVSATKGFYYYLKYYCGAHISWEGNQLNLPDVLPRPQKTFVQSPSRFIYYQNVCTWSYSFIWWKWNDWRRHIDWMSLSGINLSLAPFQEDIWIELYSEMGLTKTEILQHLSGPGFLAWQRMGNIRGWGGPISKNFLRHASNLQMKIIKAARDLGMFLALPAFNGLVPVAFKRIYPNNSFTHMRKWSTFTEEFCCPLFINPTEPMYAEIAKRFLRKVIARYGTDHFYFSDPYNKLQPRLNNTKHVGDVAAGVYNAMKSVDSKAVWILQSWVFVKSPVWTPDARQDFLTAVPIGNMLVLDVQSDQNPQYYITNSYYGQPFIWCMLHNFGGNLGLQGSAEIVVTEMVRASKIPNSTMVGAGITPEGINQNYVMYELALEMGWYRNVRSVSDWIVNYAKVRYGKLSNTASVAWLKLLKSVYSYSRPSRMAAKYTVCRRPSVDICPWVWYNISLVEDAWRYMLNSSFELSGSPLFLHDLVDITRQNLQLKGDQLYIAVVAAYKNKSADELEMYSVLFMHLLYDLERILASNKDFLLGRWLESAKELGTSSSEKKLYEFNARNQITLWGPKGEIFDYANRQWSGIVIDYFVPRWKIFFSELKSSLANNKAINESKLDAKIFKYVELPFNLDDKLYPTEAAGDPVAISAELFNKWTPLHLPDVPKEHEDSKWRKNLRHQSATCKF